MSSRVARAWRRVLCEILDLDPSDPADAARYLRDEDVVDEDAVEHAVGRARKDGTLRLHAQIGRLWHRWTGSGTFPSASQVRAATAGMGTTSMPLAEMARALLASSPLLQMAWDPAKHNDLGWVDVEEFEEVDAYHCQKLRFRHGISIACPPQWSLVTYAIYAIKNSTSKKVSPLNPLTGSLLERRPWYESDLHFLRRLRTSPVLDLTGGTETCVDPSVIQRWMRCLSRATGQRPVLMVDDDGKHGCPAADVWKVAPAQRASLLRLPKFCPMHVRLGGGCCWLCEDPVAQGRWIVPASQQEFNRNDGVQRLVLLDDAADPTAGFSSGISFVLPWKAKASAGDPLQDSSLIEHVTTLHFSRDSMQQRTFVDLLVRVWWTRTKKSLVQTTSSLKAAPPAPFAGKAAVLLVDDRANPMSVLSARLAMSSLSYDDPRVDWRAGPIVLTASEHVSYYRDRIPDADVIAYPALDAAAAVSGSGPFNIDIYNELLTDPALWAFLAERIGGSDPKVLVVQDDGVLLRRGVEKYVAYEYVGAPWDPTTPFNAKVLRRRVSGPALVGNGGLSLRSVKAMQRCCCCSADDSRRLFAGDAQRTPEDVFFASFEDLTRPTAAEANAFASEQVLAVAADCLGVHKPWPYHDADAVMRPWWTAWLERIVREEEDEI